MSYPATPLVVRRPSRTAVPYPAGPPTTARRPRTKSRVTPYLRQQRPPALVATFPPMVDHGALAGSGGYQRPRSATAAFRSLFTMPACTTQVMLSASMSRMAVIRDRSTTKQASTALAPPDSPVPAPRGTIGVPSSAAMRTAVRTSDSSLARIATAARPTVAHSASSCEMLCNTSRSTTSRSAGSSRPRASIRIGTVPIDVVVIPRDYDRTAALDPSGSVGLQHSRRQSRPDRFGPGAEIRVRQAHTGQSCASIDP